MAAMGRRSWRLQDFTAHDAKVNCLALGHKSGRVMVTGGDDKKVNLWAIGKQSCFMSLTGHITPIECVQFNQLEELVAAGSRNGALKVWDLEAAKLVRTLNGHRDTIKCIDFHPYGDFLASGSADKSIKMWDTRKKGCISTFPGHKLTVNSIRFSPDGQWIASGGEEGAVKIWDLRIGRVLKEFGEHASAVTCVEFHPHEFLLTSGSVDRSVNFFDLENFNLVSSEKDLGAVRSLCFNPDGECLFAGVRDYLKVVGWEPSRLMDSVPVNWGRVADVSTAQNQLVGASFHLTNVQIYVVDLKKIRPFLSSTPSTPTNLSGSNLQESSPFSHGQSVRKSFSKAERPVSLKNRTLDVKTIEESTSGTDPEEESTADITNIKDYNEIFKGRGLTRTPPIVPEPFEEPISYQEPPENDFSDPTVPQILSEILTGSLETLSLDNNFRNQPPNNQPPSTSPSSTNYSRSKSNLEQVYTTRDRENILPNINKANNNKPVQKFGLQRQNSCKDVPEKLPKTNSTNSIKSLYDSNSNRGNPSRTQSRKNSFSKATRQSSVPNVSKIPHVNGCKSTNFERPSKSLVSSPTDIYVNSKVFEEVRDVDEEEDEYFPVSLDKPAGLAVDDFLPKNHQILGYHQHLPNMSDAEVLNVVLGGHEPMLGIVKTRQRNLQLVLAQYRSKDMKAALELIVSTGDVAILVDILGVILNKYPLWNLDVCLTVLPKMQDLLLSKFETYITTGCDTLKMIIKHFGPVIRNNIQSPVGSFGVDISREERFQKSQKCYELLTNLRQFVNKRQTLPNIGATFREISALISTTFD